MPIVAYRVNWRVIGKSDPLLPCSPPLVFFFSCSIVFR